MEVCEGMLGDDALEPHTPRLALTSKGRRHKQAEDKGIAHLRDLLVFGIQFATAEAIGFTREQKAKGGL